MKNFKIKEGLEKFTYALEIFLTFLLAIGITIGVMHLIMYFFEIFNSPLDHSYDVFKHFLAHALLLVVGIELMLMLLSHSTNAILELVLFVIARKMLIYAETMLDLVLGTLAIAIVFAIIKYLAPKKDFVARHDNIFTASTHVERLVRETGMDLPTHRGKTLGGLVSNLAKESNVTIASGVEFSTDDLCIKIVKAEEGVIEKVMITPLNSDDNE